jgi:uncharacterized protein (TIGR02147 family)
MIFNHMDPVGFLKEQLAERAKANPSYSLRAFARKLELSPGGLSLILARKKRFSAERAVGIARALELDAKESEYFVLLNQFTHAKNEAYRTLILEKLALLRAVAGQGSASETSVLSVDRFRLISEWYGLACLELVTCVSPSQGKWNSRLIAERLTITPAEADAMIERLKRLQLIEETTPGVYVRKAHSVAVTSETPNDAIRSYYEGVHGHSSASIRSQGPDTKSIGAQVFAFDPADLPQVKKLTDEFLLGLNEIATRGKNRSEVYQAIANVFRLSAPEAVTKKVRLPSTPKSKQSPKPSRKNEVSL